MYTKEQIKALKEFKQILDRYNQGEIDFSEYAKLTLPLWNRINQLFEKKH